MAAIRNPAIVKSDMEGIFGRVAGASGPGLRVPDEPKARALVVVSGQASRRPRTAMTLVPLGGGLAIVAGLLIASTTVGTGGATTLFAGQEERPSATADLPAASSRSMAPVLAKNVSRAPPVSDRATPVTQAMVSAPQDDDRPSEPDVPTLRPAVMTVDVPAPRTAVARAAPRRVPAKAAAVVPARAETGPCGRRGICDYGDVLAADERLMQAYDRAVDAGLPRRELLFYRNRWSEARRFAHDDPAQTISRYDDLAATLSNVVVVDDLRDVSFEP